MAVGTPGTKLTPSHTRACPFKGADVEISTSVCPSIVDKVFAEGTNFVPSHTRDCPTVGAELVISTSDK